MSIKDFLENLPDSVELENEFVLQWSMPEVGFGQFRFYTKDNVVYCDNECMSKEFIKKILCHMIDNCVLED